MTPERPPLANVLPRFLAERLQDASRWPGTAFDRLKAIDQVTQQIKFAFPQYFKDQP